MVRSGAPRPGKRSRSIPPSPLRRNSGRPVGNHAESAPSRQHTSSLVTPSPNLDTTSNMSFLNDTSTVSSLPDHSSGGGRPVAAGGLMATSRNFQQQSGGGGAPDVLGPAKFDPRAFTSTSPTAQGQQPHNLYSSRMSLDHSQPDQLNMMQNYQGSSSMPHMQRQTELREGLGNVGSAAFVNMEPQMGSSDQNGPLQHSQSPCHTGTVNLEPHQVHSGRGLGPGKMESEHSYSALFLQQQQEQQLFKKPRPRPKAAYEHISMQQQQLLQMPGPPSQAASAQISPQQQQILRSIPQQQDQLQAVEPKVKSTLYEPGICARHLTHYMYRKQHRPHDNNIGFWRELVAEYFTPNAKRRWCVSLYENGPQTTGVFPQDIWQCEICNRKPARGVVTNVEVLPRLLQIKYASGILEELLYVDMPQEYQNAAGQIVLQYAKAVQESVFEQLRVAREGHLRIVFSPELKICSWEFCARHHEEFIPRRLFMPQVNRLNALVQEYQNSVQNSTFGLSAWELERTCKLLMETAGQLVKALEVPVVNDLANKKCYLRCLQILEVLDSMKDLIDYSIQTGTGPIDSLINFPKRTASSSVLHSQQVQQPDVQQTIPQYTSQCDQTSAYATGVQLLSASGSLTSVANTLNNLPSTCTTTTTAGLRQNSLNSRQDNRSSNVNGPHTGNTVPIPPASSISLRQSQPNVFPRTPSSIPSTSNNFLTSSDNIGHLDSVNSPVIASTMKQPLTESQEDDPTESPSVDRTLQEMMTSQRTGVSSLGHQGVSGTGSGITGEIRPLKTAGTSRGEMAKNTVAMNEQAGINYRSNDPSDVIHQQQEDMNRLFDGLEPLDNFDILQLIQELSQ